ncbi:PilT/PilU family type 4a pilus ATPase [Thiomicrorhabdus sp. ZW0627]|uniref:PilT/PilU family type 4a pilus ATPase n=1 Tax=Thiomicrorhabdus sp. ZW0627 TaxID=3039774 RepID=UPI002436EEBA|nr:PilT/PilU family type 4a pilus ATPase [Thiomicrorhabdus sp. ZW0627]MDG6773605.1 PilT/PilU family type 4a pilus ATPase [Thiomicrorhabdus sp. ZW0627]
MSNELKEELHKLLIHFSQNRGSDLFITAGSPVIMKKDGSLHHLTEVKLTPEMTKEFAVALMNEDQKQTFEETHECNFAYHIPGTARYRVNVFVQRGTPGLVIRSVLTDIPHFDDLDLPPILKDLILTKRGMILIVGGTGSGKSTTLASLLDIRNMETDGHIITIEDPIEFVHSHKKSIVTQREVGVDTESYDAALKNTLRQAPDVILIGEIRSDDTMNHAVAFAETGHLCLSTLHANNTNQALDRIINFFPPIQRNHVLMDLSLNLKAMVSQRLIPKIGGGRVAAVEVMINTPRMQDLIFKADITGIKKLMEESEDQNMQTFDKALFDLYEAGKISYEEALRNADSMNNLRLKIKLESKLPIPEIAKKDLLDANFKVQEETEE